MTYNPFPVYPGVVWQTRSEPTIDHNMLQNSLNMLTSAVNTLAARVDTLTMANEDLNSLCQFLLINSSMTAEDWRNWRAVKKTINDAAQERNNNGNP